MNAPEPQTVGQKMAGSRRWLLYKLIGVKGQGKAAKVPYYANGRPRGTLPDRDEKGEYVRCPLDSEEDVAQLVTYDEARSLLDAHAGGFKGLGFALGPDGTGNFWQGVDFDEMSQNPHLGIIAKQMVGYRETSPSGDGLHWIGYGPNNFDTLTKCRGIEAYSHGRFFTVTMKDVQDHPLIDLSDVVQRVLVPLRPKAEQQRIPRDNMFMKYQREVLTLEQLRALLNRIPIAELGHFDWCNVLMGVHHQFAGTEDAEAALAICTEWSAEDFRPGSYRGERALVKKWASFGRNPNLCKPGAAITIGTVKSLAEQFTPFDLKAELQRMFAQQPGSPAIPAGDPGSPAIPAGDPAGDPAAEPRPFGAKHIGEFLADGREQGWLIKGVLPDRGLSQCYGDTMAGKTFATMDMMLAVARGEPWCGHRVRQGNAVYVAAEGASGARKRFRAYGKHHGIEVADLPVIVLDEPPNIMEEEQLLKLAATIRGMGRVDLIVIDTLAQVMFGADENGSEGMGKAIARLTQIAHALEAMVLVVHHSGKDSAKGARGWSGQKGALDAQFEVTKTLTGQRGLTVTKQKDGESGKAYPFSLKVIPLGVDSDGDEITSCVAVMGDMQPGGASGASGMPPEDARVRGEWQIKVMRHIGDALSIGLPLAYEEVIEAVVDSTVPTPGKPDRRRELIARAINRLVDKDVISIVGFNIVKFDPNSRMAIKPVEDSHTPHSHHTSLD